MRKPILHLDTFLSTNDILSPYVIDDEDPFIPNIDNIFQLDKYKPILRSDQIDIYKPISTRNHGCKKEGLCGKCNKWYKLKNSSYWYHMNYIHGINSKGVKYPEPEIKITRGVISGYCEVCKGWINLGYKTSEKSSRFGWYRHCQKKHSVNKTL